MAQYYSDQYQQHPPQGQPGHPDPYNRRYGNTTTNPNSAHHDQQSQMYGYNPGSAVPQNNHNTAMGVNQELFMGSSAPPAQSYSYAHQAYSPQYAMPPTPTSYNPQDYAGPLSPAVSPPTVGVARMPSFPASDPRPYNPADYVESNLHRTATSASRASYYSSATPSYGAPLSSPSIYQSATSNRPTSMYNSRPQVQTQFSPRQSHYASLMPPPLPAIPGSAESPRDDWRHAPTRYDTSNSRYGPDGMALSPHQLSAGAYDPSRNSTGPYSAAPNYGHSQASSPGPTPPPHSSYTGHTSHDQRLGSRPLPRVPSDSDYFTDGITNGVASPDEGLVQQDLEHQIMNLTTNDRNSYNNSHNAYPEEEDDDDDPEAMAGLAAMREAELQDEAEQRRQSGGGFAYQHQVPVSRPLPEHQDEDHDSDSDTVPVDIASFGGGFDVHMSYGGEPNELTVARASSQRDTYSASQTVSSSSSMRRPNESAYYNGNNAYDPAQSPDMRQARVDAYGTGGLADPSTTGRTRRLSYDEGDEGPLMDYSTLAPGEPADMAFYPSVPAGRPLPPKPSTEALSTSGTPYPSDYVQSHHIQFPPVQPYSPGTLNAQPPAVMPGVPRHLSEKRFGTLPAAIAPARAKTDADDNKRRPQRPYSAIAEVTSSTAGSAAVTLDLPSLTRKFNPQKLTSRDFNQCTEPWAVSAVISWLRLIIEGDQFLKRSQLLEALVALFTHKVATMHIAVAEVLADKLIQDMEAGGALHYEEEWLFFSETDMSGVLYHLTGAGCYSSRLHDHESHTRCYAPYCQRTERKIDLSAQPAMGDAEWKFYYIKAGLLTEEQFDKLDKKEIARQNVYHEIIQKEESYLNELDVLVSVYRNPLANANPPVIPPKKLQGFVWEIFGKVDAVRKANEEHLLPQMKYRQKEQGPFITGFSDILREWVRKARPAYIDYASQFPQAAFKVRQELEKNMLFRSFMERCQLDPRSKRLDWTHFLKLPVSRLQHFNLLLKTAAGKSEDSEETRNLRLAISEVESLLDECDARVGDGTRKVDLSDLQNKLKLRPNMQRVDLNLDHLGREVLFQGEVLRIGGSRFTWLETHAILFDHYLVLAKATYTKGPDGPVKSDEYDVSRLPIPMDLLVLDTRDDDPVIRTTLGGRAGVTKVAPNAEVLRMQRQLPNGQIAPELRHSSTSTSLQSLNRATSAQSPGPQPLNGADMKEDKTLYPFRLKHLGKQTYTLYASTYQNREDWCDRIEQAKTKHAAALFTQNAEPFKLRVMADSAFAYDGQVTGQKSIVVKGTPLDRAIRDVEKKYAHTGRPGPVCRAKINCATAFFLSPGKQMVAVGTDFGVYISDTDDPRGWQRVIQSPKVTQISVLEEFSVLLLLSDKSLIAYHLDQVCPANGVAPQNDNARRAPQKLSGSRDVGFFATGRMKDRTLVFYKKRDGIHSTFKVITVLEPVFQKSSEKRSRFNQLRHGKTEFFRDFDEFYIPTECMGMNMFHSSLAISTQKGFEILTLDKKQPISIPDLEQSHVQMIASRLAGQKPLGMFRLSEQEFLLCYEECAVYVNKHGDISRSVIMEFVGKARAAALYGPYVLLFDPDFVEIRNAQNGRLRQVIAGRDVRCLDDAVVGGAGGFVSEGSRTVKIALQHPAVEKLMVVLELLLNEGTRE